MQNCCSLRLLEVQFGLVTTPQLFRNFPANSPQLSRNFPHFFRNFLQLDLTHPDRNPPPPLMSLAVRGIVWT